MAYRMGLDRLENLRMLYPEWRVLDREVLQEWRTLWWFIYRLDSYSNISSGTPFLIDDKFINTSLVLSFSSSSSGSDGAAPENLRMPSNPEFFWKIIPALSSNPETFLQNAHLVAISATRQAGVVLRHHCVLSKEELVDKDFSAFERHLSALRLALPSGWFNPKRNAFSNETQAYHHGRLNSVILLLMSQLLISIIGCAIAKNDEWLSNWQRILETCQGIASVAAEYDTSFCIKVDPAICFVYFTALIFLEMHRKSSTFSVPDLLSNIEHDQTVLRLQLEQFAKIWTLPKLLISKLMLTF
ncbi:hypothetical protein N7532_008129 [Penicillium argentinense]|uniref:Xylanolytic transcriptional activator regulatory domain-containing protein n=1 Tax=Penicillium argentinense TaxID=1131581 RepID=A0A9W9K1K1_9EURO|nr:uncharacterized protein N7532_008129 [Penicillium argentinense]KAJ5089445.1 hypothetical protein N7532_008129 [Penicillium argentinense]